MIAASSDVSYGVAGRSFSTAEEAALAYARAMSDAEQALLRSRAAAATPQAEAQAAALALRAAESADGIGIVIPVFTPSHTSPGGSSGHGTEPTLEQRSTAGDPQTKRQPYQGSMQLV